MATSRLERVGTIFSRVEGLIRSGAMRVEDRPLWWDIYKAFPPAREPVFERPAPNMTVREIFYPEDIIRSKFHKSGEPIGTVSLADDQHLSNAQKLIQIHDRLQRENVDETKCVYTQSLEVLKQQLGDQKDEYEARKEAGKRRSEPLDPAKEAKQATDIKGLFTE